MNALPQIEHPKIGATAQPNFTIVTIGVMEYAFSYRTLVGVRRNDGGSIDYTTPTGFRRTTPGWVVRRNNWGTTTGKHLNYLDGGGGAALLRVELEQFQTILNEVQQEVRYWEMSA